MVILGVNSAHVSPFEPSEAILVLGTHPRRVSFGPKMAQIGKNLEI